MLFTLACIYSPQPSQADCKDPSAHTSENVQLKQKTFVSCETLRADPAASPAATLRLVNEADTVPLSTS